MDKSISHSESQELTQAKKLIDMSKLDEADQIIRNFEEEGRHTLHDIVLCHLLKCEVLYWRGLHKDAVKLAEKTFKESIGLGKYLFSVDILLIMAAALIELYQTDKAHDIITQGEELLKSLTHELRSNYKQKKAYIAYLKGWVYAQKGEADQAIKQIELSIPLQEEIGAKKEIARSHGGLAWIYMWLKGDLNRASKYAEQELGIAEESGNKYCIGWSLIDLGWIYWLKGDLNRCIRSFELSLELFKELNNKSALAVIFSNLSIGYKMKEESDRALECIEQAIIFNRELGNLVQIANDYDYLIQILVDRGEIERSQKALEQFEQLKNQYDNKLINLLYRYDKALVLKTSSRSRDRIEAEDILKQIIEEGIFDYQVTVSALLTLCELLLIELGISNDLSVLEEINFYTGQLLKIAEKNRSHKLFAEAYFLKAKLALLTLDLKNARRFLTQAQKIAERFGLNQLATNISLEYENLSDQLNTWENLKNNEISITERIKLAELDKHMKELLHKSPLISAQISEKKVTVHREQKICLLCKGDVSGYMYTCSCDAIYCENCARTLTDLENVCWVCNSPIDVSKPTKPFEEEKLEEKDIIKEPAKKSKKHKR
ncbi:MAG: tetratricopeptide repeat protein [Candidatus Hermodarchaeota archaeon]